MVRSNLVAAALAFLALGSALCKAAPKVEIKIIQRPRPEAPPALVPIPIREPFKAPNGPFWNDLQSLSCVREEREMKKGKTYTMDLCHLANVTIVTKIEEPEEMTEVEAEVFQDELKGSLTTEGEDSDAAQLVDPASEEKDEDEGPEIPTILGIFRGWHIDPITLNYKHMIYDDGDECGDDGERFSITVELIPSSNEESDTRLFGLKKTGECTFKGSLLAYVPEDERRAQGGIHTPGVLDISDASTSLPVICGKMKCRYEDISTRVRNLQNQVRQIQQMVAKGSFQGSTMFTNMTIEASKSVLESSTQILEGSLELLREIEDMQRSFTTDFLGHEEAAAKEIAKLDAAAKKSELEKTTSGESDGEPSEPVDEIKEKDKVTAES
ncbi:hypothetical protein PHYBOEH_005699 [Phytophthora boehmeriae]|uniref:Uncharacterized protein n=1 Tax=Phytophthora boehmeriae TaxID=109152 RepID=A0A8T1X8I1_9STRA|nr:hypothetical protein PHYBOEH_005699 [Phytophthora boehmeriae]